LSQIFNPVNDSSRFDDIQNSKRFLLLSSRLTKNLDVRRLGIDSRKQWTRQPLMNTKSSLFPMDLNIHLWQYLQAEVLPQGLGLRPAVSVWADRWKDHINSILKFSTKTIITSLLSAIR